METGEQVTLETEKKMKKENAWSYDMIPRQRTDVTWSRRLGTVSEAFRGFSMKLQVKIVGVSLQNKPLPLSLILPFSNLRATEGKPI
jgi:hypothetical protein